MFRTTQLFRKDLIQEGIFWLLYFAFFLLIFSLDVPHWPDLLLFTGCHILIQLTASYITTLYLIPNYLYTRHYGRFVGLYGLVILAATALSWPLLSQYYVPNNPVLLFNISKKTNYLTYHLLYTGSLFTVFTTAITSIIRLYHDQFQAERRAKLLETDKLEMELQFLKAQINPHFLFNAMNSIFTLIDTNPTQARDTLVKFSDMLRYQLYETGVETVSLKQELNYLQSYAALEQVRKGKNIRIDWSVATDVYALRIAPFVLLTFVENAFKHVSTHWNQPNWVRIELYRTADTLHIAVRNSRNPVATSGSLPGGIGLANVQRRLALAYPDAHKLTVRSEPNAYTVLLTLNVA